MFFVLGWVGCFLFLSSGCHFFSECNGRLFDIWLGILAGRLAL